MTRPSAMATELAELLERWDSGEGKPYKGRLIDWAAYEANETNIGCMCAQGQVLHLLGGWSPKPPFGERLVRFFRRWQFSIGIASLALATLIGCYFAFQMGRGAL